MRLIDCDVHVRWNSLLRTSQKAWWRTEILPVQYAKLRSMIINTVDIDRVGRYRATGYAHSSYAGSLEEVGVPRHLAECDGWFPVRHHPYLACPFSNP